VSQSRAFVYRVYFITEEQYGDISVMARATTICWGRKADEYLTNASVDTTLLLVRRLLSWPSASPCFALCRKLTEMFAAVLARCGPAAFMPHSRCRCHLGLLDEIIGERQRRTEIFATMGRAVLGKIRNGFESKVCIGDQVSKGQQ